MGSKGRFDIHTIFGKKSIYDGIEPYAVNMADDKSAEVNLYGAVVSTHPTGWNGEKAEGLFIALDDFLSDLEGLRGMESVRFNINSVGGEVNAGIAIFNKIRELSSGGVGVTTRVEGAADSAAALIAQAGDKREVCLGSEMMVHCASCLLFDYYDSKALDGVKAMLDSTDTRIAGLLANRTGKTEQETMRLMRKTTWMDAHEAVREGFADEVVNEAVSVEAARGRADTLIFNGVPHAFRGIPLPFEDNAGAGKTAGEDPAILIDEETTEGGREMTRSELEAKYPDIVREIRDEAERNAKAGLDGAINSAVEAERERIRGIEEIEGSLPDKALARKAKYDEPASAQELALAALKAQARVASAWDAARAADLMESGADGVEPEPTSGSEAEDRRRDIMDGAALIAGIRKEAD